MMDIKKINDEIDDFVSERNWGKFHKPKNLVMALSGEVGELNECFQWLDDEDIENVKNSPEKKGAFEHEIADVFIYLLRIANKMNIDLEDVVYKKLELNKLKYPVETNQGVVNKN